MRTDASLFAREVAPITPWQLQHLSKRQTPSVKIRELVVLTNDDTDTHGEIRKKSATAAHSLTTTTPASRDLLSYHTHDDCKATEKTFCSEEDFTRLVQHALSLIGLANAHHAPSPYCITRIGTAEFYFYTQAPLDENQFVRLLDFVKAHAKKMQHNVHALLSSFAVWIGDQLCNIALYTTCGESAEVHTIIKAEPSTIDFDYHDPDNLFRQSTEAPAASGFAAGGVILPDGRLLTNNHILTIKVDDTTIQVVTVICFDHANEYGHRLLYQQLDHDRCQLATPLYDYVLTSNTVTPKVADAPTTVISQYDPVHSRSKPGFDADDYLVALQSPAFGPACSVYDMGTKPIPSLTSLYEEARRRHNIRIYQRHHGCRISQDSVHDSIQQAINEDDYDKAIRLLPLSLHTPLSQIRILAYTHIAALPAKELNQLMHLRQELAKSQINEVALRSAELETEQLDKFAQVILSNHAQDRELLNLIAQQGQRLSTALIYQILSTDDLYDQLSPASLNVLASCLEEIHDDAVIHKLAPHFSDFKFSAQLSIIKKASHLSATVLSDICLQVLNSKLPNPLLLAVCQQVHHLPTNVIQALTKKAHLLSHAELNTIAAAIPILSINHFNYLLCCVERLTTQSFILVLERTHEIRHGNTYNVLLKAATSPKLSAEQFDKALSLLPYASPQALLSISYCTHSLSDTQFNSVAIQISNTSESFIENFIQLNANRSITQLAILYNYIAKGTRTDDTLAQLIIKRSIAVVQAAIDDSLILASMPAISATNIIEAMQSIYECQVIDALAIQSIPDLEDLSLAFKTITASSQIALHKQLQTYSETNSGCEDSESTFPFAPAIA
ncbi:MAG: hypothetical protein P1U34_11170 [Coxiellaceae bacterium]|nr:hypothetical protein [Coxiellaceae bacterium]